MNFRPHSLKFKMAGEGYYDDNNDWCPNGGNWSDPIPCRFQQNGNATEIPIKDGKGYIYQYVVFIDLSERDFNIGEEIQKEGDDTVFQVKGFQRTQMHCKLWV